MDGSFSLENQWVEMAPIIVVKMSADNACQNAF
jgi:hypothetical protein